MDRKEIVKTLSTALNSTAKYLGAPSFAYEIKTDKETYTIDKHGCIITSEGKTVTVDEILNGEKVEVDTAVDTYNIEIPLLGHTGRTLINVLNMINSKQQLIMKALELKEWIVNTFLYNFYSVAFDNLYSTGVM